jgi:hypothetical protein
MSKVVKADFAKEGIGIGDMRAVALAKWFATKLEGATADEIKQEMARLRQIMPAPEDAQKMQEHSDRLHDALQQLVDWVKDGCPEDGYSYCMTEAQAALKGLSVTSGDRK